MLWPAPWVRCSLLICDHLRVKSGKKHDSLIFCTVSVFGLSSKAEYKIWECNKCATTTCYDCRKKWFGGDRDDIVSSCDEHAPCSVEKDRNCLLCMDCRSNTCCKKYQEDEYCCLNCKGWAFNHLLKLTTSYILRQDRERQDRENMSVRRMK